MKSALVDSHGENERLFVTIPEAARLLGVSRVIAWGYAKNGLLGPIRVINKRGKMHIDASELIRRFGVDPNDIRTFRHG